MTTPTANLATAGPAFLPFHNRWNEDTYLVDGDFSHQPCTHRAGSTGGAPVAITRDGCIGLLDPDPGARLLRQGGTITALAAEPGSLFVRRGCPEEAWRAYEAALRLRHPDPAPAPGPALRRTLAAVEYCTWCEQKWIAHEAGGPGLAGAVEALSHDMVLRYLERIARLALPAGVVTLDHGWAAGSAEFRFDRTEPDPRRFPDLAATVAAIRAAGHTPGAWLAPGFLWDDSPLFAREPGLRGPYFDGANEGGFTFPLRYLAVDDRNAGIVREHFRGIFAPLVALGVRKFKIDYMYGNRLLMAALLREMRSALKQLDAEAELESHIPDWFSARWQDAIRLNDLVPETNPAWPSLLERHYLVCAGSAAGRQLNLDHVGTNSPRPTPEMFSTSIRGMAGKDGYPVLSLLPDRLGDEAVSEAVRSYLAGYEAIKHEALARRLAGSGAPDGWSSILV